MLCLDGTKMLFVVDQLSVGHQNKSYDNENNNKYSKNKSSLEKREKKVSKPFNTQAFLLEFYP